MTPELLDASMDVANAQTALAARREPASTLTIRQRNLAAAARRNAGKFPMPSSHRAANHPSVADAEFREQRLIDGHDLPPGEQPLSEWQGLADACLTSVIVLGLAALVCAAVAYGVGII
jgi:hypothetical protein